MATFPTTGVVIAVCRSAEPGMPKPQVEELHVVTNWGWRVTITQAHSCVIAQWLPMIQPGKMTDRFLSRQRLWQNWLSKTCQ